MIGIPRPIPGEKAGFFDYRKARKLSELGRAATLNRDLDAAEAFYREALQVTPQFAEAWFNLGLIYKHRREWKNALDANANSTILTGHPGDPAFWNLGIAATALGDWATARSAWVDFGLPVPDGTGPIQMNFGITPVRLKQPDKLEVVWGERICPARIVISNIPLPGGTYNWGDTVLHDGTPAGERVIEGKSHTVFNGIERLESSNVPVWRLVVDGPIGELPELRELFGEAGWGYEDWSTTFPVCSACSFGSETTHDHTEERQTRNLVAACPHDVAVDLMENWASSRPGFTFRGVELSSSVGP